VSENLDLVKSIYDKWAQGDFADGSWADPEIEFTMLGGLNNGTWVGVAAMKETWGEMLAAWDHLRAVPEEIRELDDGRVLVLLTNAGRGKESGIEIGGFSIKAANVFEVEAGKVKRLTLYWDRDAALADLGLEGGDAAGT
jgi:ketosteroid isomerase-like protein